MREEGMRMCPLYISVCVIRIVGLTLDLACAGYLCQLISVH